MRGALLLSLWLVALAAAAQPTVALIIDDLGYSRERARRALALPPPVTMAILPYAPYSHSIARAAHRAGTDTLVHMPMEARRGPPAPHALRGDMGEAALRAAVGRALDAVPHAIGLNNHEGSGLTARRPAMDAVMQALAHEQRPLLFIDSRTTADTAAEAAARRAGIPVARRHVFLDHRLDAEAIEAATRAWLERARRTGCALAIGHPHPVTLRVLERILPRADDVRRVDLRTYIEHCGTPARPEETWRASSSPSPTAARNSRPSP